MEISEINEKMDLCIQAYASGKVSDAQNYADEALHVLFELKKIPAITQFITQIKNLGYPAKKLKHYETWLVELQGRPGKNLNHLEWHIDHFKSSEEFFKNYLVDQEEWSKDQYGLCYEYILRFGHNSELFEKIESLKNNETEETSVAPKKENSGKGLNFNYEQLAYELISGKKSVEDLEQEKIISGLKLHDFEKMKNEGSEMVTAFRFLGMDEVVQFICAKLIPLHDDVKARASLTFLSIESLMNQTKNYQALQIIEGFLKKEPVYGEEKLALLYLRAEIYFLLGKNDDSLKYFQEVQKINPHYRLVNQRLKSLEAN